MTVLRCLGATRPWRSLWYLGVGAVGALPMLALVKWALKTNTPVGYLTGVVLIVMVNVLLAAPLAAMERRRLKLIDRSSASRAPLGKNRLWRELGYAVAFTAVIAVVDFLVVIVALSVLIVPLSPLLEFVLDTGSIVNLEEGPVPSLAAVLVGIALLPVAAYLISLVARIQAAFARRVLTQPDTGLADRVAELTRSRTRLVDAFEAERKRIERDLHDGAQQRLVALTMTLGIAELDLAGLGGEGPRLVSKARAEAECVLADLRELIRGIHPQVLTDRGVEAAVAEIADRCPIPVEVHLDLPRAPAAVEAVAYFAVSEALTNVVKHSRAARVDVTGACTGRAAVVTVLDDGDGGADPAGGTGLQGLADRVAVVGGRLTLSSPPGGPTELRVELPWACG
ncbi:histidine kinase [Amycolatopsis sp. cg5]|uniref:sensor histidine kinase n=1 Tax=Amycolatopsis sp. cg5 TaxID=3238802 RepID=UPI0035232B9B